MSDIINGNETNVVETEVKKEEIINPTTGKVVKCTLLNVRKRPKTTAEILQVIKEGDKVELIDFSNRYRNLEFYKVKLSDGTVGFCMSKYIEVE